MALCTVCKGIPTNFFGPLPPNFFSPRDRLFHYRHHTTSALHQSAANGCPMCKILACRLQDNWLPQEAKDRIPLTMKRGIIDSQQSFGLWMGQDDISHNCFYVVPPKYQQALPQGRVDQNDNEDLLMRHWVNDCVENHARCRENFRSHCPTRLLDLVQYWSSGDIVLVERVEHADEYIPYTALSHCWGTPPSRPLITTLANLTSRKERIRFDELPLTFKDAVTTTRKLKIPYLWIDSLCIIQDSRSDWEREAGRMALVYAGSICTLSALGAHDSQGGFFRVAEKERGSVYRYDLNLGSQRIRVFPCEPNDWLLDGPLLERAWTLQERELSIRILHFSRNELLWECKTLRASVDLPWLKYRAYDSVPAPKLLYDSAEESSGQNHHSLGLRRRWFETVLDYSGRQLTNSRDKLIALSGLAHSYYERQSKSGVSYKDYKGGRRGKYAAGLWEADMPSALLWQTPSGQRPSEYRAPSWSWASVDGRISYHSQFLESETQHGGIWVPDEPPSPREPLEYDFGAFRVEEIEATTSSLDSMGAVSAGHITLAGLIAITIVDEASYTDSESDLELTFTWLRDRDGLAVGALFADVQTEVRPNNIHCVSVRNEPDGALVKMPEELRNLNHRTVGDESENIEMIMGLGLIKIGDGDDGNVFKRLGLVRWVRKDLFIGKEVSTIRII